MAAFNGTIEIRENPVTSAKTYSRTFERSAAAKDSGYSDVEFSHRADGGYYRARFMLKGPRAELSEFMNDGLGREVVILGNDGKKIWEGYVHKLEYDAGRVAYSADLGALSNSVWLRYRVRGASTTSRSTTQSDTDSIANYGTKQFILSGGELESSAVADSIALQYLNNHKAPSGAPTRIDPEKELAEFPTISVECRGWFDTLNWQVYNQTSATDNQGASAQIDDIIGTRASSSIIDVTTWDETADIEENDLTDFAATAGNVSASSDANLSGTYGMAINTTPGANSYGQLSGPTDEASIAAEFRFDPNSLAMAANDLMFVVLGNLDVAVGGSANALRVDFTYDGANYNLRLTHINDAGTAVPGALHAITDEPHVVRAIHIAASGAGNDDGEVHLYIDGELKESVTGIDNDQRLIDYLRFGAVGIDAGTSGIFYMDDMRWSDDNLISTVSATGIGQFVKSKSILTNATLVSKEYDADRRGGDIVSDIARLGDASGNRWLAYMDDDREFIYEPARPPLDQD